MFDTICVGFDGSEPSENALRAACAIAEKFNGSVHVVHVPKHETVAFALGAVSGYHAATTMPSKEEVAEAAAIVTDTAKKIADVEGHSEVTCHIVDGDPATAVVDKAKAVGADLIVSGRRGLGNLSAMVLGSTSSDISHRAHCAHLTVK